ncbi:MAG: hypothetical protein AB7T49_01820 [Oligoflexales bacterium]
MLLYVRLLLVMTLIACKAEKGPVDIGKSNRSPGQYNKPSNTDTEEQKNGGINNNTNNTNTNTNGQTNNQNTGDGTNQTNTGEGTDGENTGNIDCKQRTWTVDDFAGTYTAAKPLGQLLNYYFGSGLELRKINPTGIHIFNGKGNFIETADKVGQAGHYEANYRLEAKIICNTLYVVRSAGTNVARFDLTLTSDNDLTVIRTTLAGSTYTENETGYFKK